MQVLRNLSGLSNSVFSASNELRASAITTCGYSEAFTKPILARSFDRAAPKLAKNTRGLLNLNSEDQTYASPANTPG